MASTEYTLLLCKQYFIPAVVLCDSMLLCMTMIVEFEVCITRYYIIYMVGGTCLLLIAWFTGFLISNKWS